MAGLQVLSAPTNQPTLAPRVLSAPQNQPTLAPKVVNRPVQPVLAPKVVSQPQQPQLAPQVQTQPNDAAQTIQTTIPPIVKGINGARLDGHTDEDILAQYIQNHPESQAPQAIADGHSASDILDQIVQGNGYQPRKPGDNLGQEPQDTQPQGDNAGNSTLTNLGLGFVKGFGQSGQSLDNILQKITGVKNNNLQVTKPTGVAQNIGAAAEQVAELFAMPEVGLADAATKIPTVARLAENAPRLAKGIELGAKALQEGTTNLGLGQLHGSESGKTDFALGAAGPIVGSGLSKVWESLPRIIGKGTGVSDDIIREAVDNRPLFLQSLKEVAANPTSPYNNLAHDVSSSLIQGEQAVKTAYREGLDKVATATKGKVFDVSPQISEFNKVLKNDYGLPVQLVRDENGKLTKQLEIVTNTSNGNPFSDSETKTINNLLNEMRGANNKSFKGLQNLQKSVDNAFDTDVFGKAKSTPFNSVIGKLSDIVDKKVASVAEEAVNTMKPLNKQYAQYKQVMREFGKKFIDRTGDTPQTATGAESYLSSLLNKNKLQQQGNVARKLEEFTGIPILDKVTSLKAAEQLSKLHASGKSNAIQKFLKTTGAAIGGGVGLHLGGAGAGIGGATAGYNIGKTAGKLAGPEAGIKAIQATKAVGNAAEKGFGKLPQPLQDVGANIGNRFFR